MFILHLLTVLVIAGFGPCQVKTAKIVCDLPADVVFAIDSSSNVGLNKYMTELQFIARLTRMFILGPHRTRFGAVIFSYYVEKVFDLKDFSDHYALETALLSARYMDSPIYTFQAFGFINYDGMFEADAGGRDDVQDILILVTNSKTNLPSKILKTARSLKAQNIKIMTVDFGSDRLGRELEAVASSTDYVFRIEYFDHLYSVLSMMFRRVCEASGMPETSTTLTTTAPPTTFTTTTKPTESQTICNLPADVVFAIDSSSSVGMNNYIAELQFIAGLTRRFTLGPHRTRFGAVIFSNYVEKVFDLKDFSDHHALETVLLSARYIDRSTYTHRAFRFINYNGMFEAGAGGRDDAQDILIFVTGNSTKRPSRTLKTARALKAQNIKILTVGFGSDTLDGELEAVASSPDYVVRTENLDSLYSLLDLMVRRACDASEMPETSTTSTTTAPPTTNTAITKPTGSQCVSDPNQGCQSFRNGDYPICYPQCQQGSYVSCFYGLHLIRDCHSTWFKAENGTWIYDKLVYDPEMKMCRQRTRFCPRSLHTLAVR